MSNVTESTDTEIDEAAETAVRNAMAAIAREGQRAYSLNVPFAAEQALVASGEGKVTHAEASQRIRAAIGAMTTRGDLEAHVEPYKDWKLLT